MTNGKNKEQQINKEGGQHHPRRRFLSSSALAAAALLSAPRIAGAFSENRTMAAGNIPVPALAGTDQRYKVSVCDWMILKRQKLGALKRTHEIGADGLELDMGGLGDRVTFDSKLDDPVVRKQFLDEAAKYNLEFSSIAMSGFYAQSFAERDIEPMINDTINTMVLMGIKVAFLPLGVRGDLVQHPELRPVIVDKLKNIVAPKAEAAGVIIGVETALDAEGEVKLLDEIGSPAIQSYFNFANALQNGRNLYKELRTLGRERICQIHATDEDGVWLENNKRIDMPKVKKTLDDMGWSGWLVIERSRDANDPRNVVKNFGANAAYLKSVFQS